MMIYACVSWIICLSLSSSSLFLIPFMLTCSMMRFFTAGSVPLCCVCSHMVVFGLYVRLNHLCYLDICIDNNRRIGSKF